MQQLFGPGLIRDLQPLIRRGERAKETTFGLLANMHTISEELRSGKRSHLSEGFDGATLEECRHALERFRQLQPPGELLRAHPEYVLVEPKLEEAYAFLEGYVQQEIYNKDVA